MKPRFGELEKVKTLEKFAGFEGYVIGSLWKDNRWVYKISFPDPDNLSDTFDNWIPEQFLERVK